MAGLISQVSGWLGLSDEQDAPAARPVAVSSDSRPAARVAQIRPRRGYADVNEIYTIEPKSYAEAKDVAANFRLGIQ